MIAKVLAYITRERGGERQLLVFEHADFPDAGVQVPKGTVESGETLESAARREVREEAGLTMLDGLEYIGAITQTAFGAAEEWNFLHCARMELSQIFSRESRESALIIREDSRDSRAKKDMTSQELVQRYNKGERDFSNADLHGMDFREEILRGIILRGANLEKADLSWANLEEADLSGANCKNAKLNAVHLRGANLSNADFTGASMKTAGMKSANLIGAIMRGTVLVGAKFHNANLRGAQLGKTHLDGADFTGADTTDMDLKYAELTNVVGLTLTDAQKSWKSVDKM